MPTIANVRAHMSADPHAAPSDSHADHPHAAPSVPTTVKDEAGDTPAWIPMVGLALLAVLGLFVVYRVANPSDMSEGAAAALDGAVEDGAAADGGTPEEAPPAPAAQ